MAKMEYTKEEHCLGISCRFYREKVDAICFKVGVLPSCSPSLKEKRIKLDTAAPELYEALRELLKWAELSYSNDTGEWADKNDSAIIQTKQVLAKAESENA